MSSARPLPKKVTVPVDRQFHEGKEAQVTAAGDPFRPVGKDQVSLSRCAVRRRHQWFHWLKGVEFSTRGQGGP